MADGMHCAGLAAMGLAALGGCGHEGGIIPRSDVHGIVEDRYHSEVSTVAMPVDLDGSVISAYRWDAEDGFSHLTGEILDRGRFVIRDVPEVDDLLLRFNTLFVALSADSERTIDLGVDWPGRAGLEFATSASVHMMLDGFEPWRAGHHLVLYSANCGWLREGLEDLVAPGIVPGSTSWDAVVDWRNRALIDATLGDSIVVFQSVREQLPMPSSGGYAYESIRTSSQEAVSIVMRDGEVADLRATLTPVTANGSMSIGVDAVAFVEMAAGVNPGATMGGYASLDMGAWATGYDPISFSLPSLVRLEILAELSSNASWLVEYGNPFPLTWPLLVSGRVLYSVPYSSPDGGSVGASLALSECVVPLEAYGSGPFRPCVGPPTSPIIENSDAFQHLTGVGTTPELRWGAPVLGQASVYSVSVIEVSWNGGVITFGPREWSILTGSMGVRIPPGVLQSGSNYVFSIAAISMPESDKLTMPMKNVPPYGYTELITGIVNP